MSRYEFKDGSSNKFWEIDLDGTSFTTSYGRIGTDGQTSLKEYDSEAKAKAEHDKLIAEKVKKGYQLVDGSGEATSPAPAKPAPAKPAAAAKPKAAKPVFDDEGDEEESPPKPAQKTAAAPAAAAAKSSKSDENGTRYFEFVDGKSSKFWEVQLEGSSFTTRYGKIGTDGQTSLKEYDGDDKARKEYEKLVNEKVKKGYVEK